MANDTKWTSDCIGYAHKVTTAILWILIGTSVLSAIAWLTGSTMKTVTVAGPYGPIEIILHPFSIIACVFSFLMARQIKTSLVKYDNHIKSNLPQLDMPKWSVFFFILGEILLFLLLIMPTLWPMLLAFLLVDRMIINAFFRSQLVVLNGSIDPREDKIVISLLVCLAVSGAALVVLIFLIEHTNWWEYTVFFPPVLIFIPRYLLRCSKVRQANAMGSYIWFHVYTIFVFIATTAQIGFRWLFNEISRASLGEKSRWFSEGKFVPDYCACDLLFFFAILGLIALVGYFYVFPQEQA